LSDNNKATITVTGKMIELIVPSQGISFGARDIDTLIKQAENFHRKSNALDAAIEQLKQYKADNA